LISIEFCNEFFTPGNGDPGNLPTEQCNFARPGGLCFRGRPVEEEI
jgi:hypothetical protein